MDWTDTDARRAATAMRELAGLHGATPELLRFGNNAVFGIGEAHVVRVMRPTTSEADVQREIQLVRELGRLDVSSVRLADLTTQQPLQEHDCLGTAWERLKEPDHGSLYGPFGQLLRTFHQRTAKLRLPLELWLPVASSDRRLVELDRHYAPDEIAMLTQWSWRIAAELDQVEPVLPGGVIHGQAEVGNVLLRADEPVFIDSSEWPSGRANGI